MYMNRTIRKVKQATKIIVAFILGFLLGIALWRIKMLKTC